MAVKGLTIVSEAILSLGIILVSIAFALVAGQVVDLQAQSLFSSTETGFADRLSGRVGQLADTNATYTTTFEPEIDTYTVRSEGKSTLTVDLPQTESEEIGFLSVNVESPRISDAEQICISRTGDNVSLTSGPCSSDVLSDFCEDGDCINDICQPERGETCDNSGGDCRCPEDSTTEAASGECLPDYKAGDYMDEEGAGDGQADSTEPIGCVQQRFVGAQERGERCAEEFECQGSLSCNPSAPTASVSGDFCCPQGKSWDPNAGPNGNGKCVSRQVFDVVYVPIKMDSPDSQKYKQTADRTQDVLENSGVFNGCANPSRHANKVTVPIDSGGACDISDCQDLNQGGSCFQKIKECAEQHVGQGNYERALGICDNEGGTFSGGSWQPGECEREDNQPEGLCGKAAGLPADSAVLFTNNACKAGRGESLAQVGVHELGHTFGLPHVNICRNPAPSPSPSAVSPPGVCTADITNLPDSSDPCINPNRQDCTASDSEAADYLMTYAGGHSIFGQDGVKFLRNNVFSSYRWQCG